MKDGDKEQVVFGRSLWKPELDALKAYVTRSARIR